MYQCSLDTSPIQGDRLQALVNAAITCSILQAIAALIRAGIETSINEGS